jgi:hypothetical protein
MAGLSLLRTCLAAIALYIYLNNSGHPRAANWPLRYAKSSLKPYDRNRQIRMSSRLLRRHLCRIGSAREPLRCFALLSRLSWGLAPVRGFTKEALKGTVCSSGDCKRLARPALARGGGDGRFAWSDGGSGCVGLSGRPSPQQEPSLLHRLTTVSRLQKTLGQAVPGKYDVDAKTHPPCVTSDLAD